MDELVKLIGQERGIKRLSGTLHELGRRLGAPVVGALHVTCADESEKECIQAFERGFSGLLPDLKYGEQSHFRIANLGARYEWGAARIAEEHFATRASDQAFKLLVVKVNAHVAAEQGPDGWTYGELDRYGLKSACCGALAGLLGGGTGQPFLDELGEAFASEGLDRVGLINAEDGVEPRQRMLVAALVSARLQARQALVDIQEHRPKTPTLYLVVPCVTVNRPGEDTEILCGFYQADFRENPPAITYQGLGDDPRAYRIRSQQGQVQVEDETSGVSRPARDHRHVVRTEWEIRADATARPCDPETESVLAEANRKKGSLEQAHPALRLALRAVAQLSPVSAAVALFAEGIAGIHHIHRAHALARRVAGDAEARRILGELQHRVDSLPAERARDVATVLLDSCRG